MLQVYKKQNALGKAALIEPTQVSYQTRLDISPAGVCYCTVKNGRMDNLGYDRTESYDNAVGAASRRLKSLSPKKGSAVIFTFWPNTVNHRQMLIGQGQKFSTIHILDQKLQIAPEDMQLDANFSWRAIDSMGKKAEVIGLPSNAFDILEDSMNSTPIVKGRYWGPLATVEVIYEKFGKDLPDPLLLGIADKENLYYFALRRGVISGMRPTKRTSLRDTIDLKNTLNSLQVDPPSAALVSLTTDSSDVEKVAQQAMAENSLSIAIVDRAELVQNFKGFDSLGDIPLFPTALLQGGMSV
jgi:hypothetical protein